MYEGGRNQRGGRRSVGRQEDALPFGGHSSEDNCAYPAYGNGLFGGPRTDGRTPRPRPLPYMCCVTVVEFDLPQLCRLSYCVIDDNSIVHISYVGTQAYTQTIVRGAAKGNVAMASQPWRRRPFPNIALSVSCAGGDNGPQQKEG